jgi:hypothetical protein
MRSGLLIENSGLFSGRGEAGEFRDRKAKAHTTHYDNDLWVSHFLGRCRALVPPPGKAIKTGLFVCGEDRME